ncbi:MAG: T9SS type A sorting domain-containing protein [Bacteroidales bacterium]|nr:T9SS type A sorting domain-containing protein [Bacteroidales bacterium]
MKKILSILLLLATMPAMIFAQTDDWDGSAEIWTQGTGTESNPYLIESAENLAWISEMVNNGVTTYEGVYFKLTTDLNMQNIAWVPIGNSTTNLFCGKFDGDHHFIDNISVTGSYPYAGLFGITGENVRIANLGVKSEINSNSSSSGYHGGIIGNISGANTHIENCYNVGNVSSRSTLNSFAGGIVGSISVTDARIEKCYNTGTVYDYSSYSSQSSSGGIVGYCGSSSLTVVDCYNTGTVYAHAYSGGIVGYCGSSGSSLNVTNCYNTGDISSVKYSSGIVGYCNSSLTVIYCYNTGNISSSGTHSGGIVGYCNSSLTVVYCYNMGDISSSGSTTSSAANVSSYSGGIVGFGNSSLSLTSCHNTGTVSSTSSYTGSSASSSDQHINAYSGGLVGGSSSGVVTKCYNKGAISATAYSRSSSYNTSTSSINRQSNSGGLIGTGIARIFNSYNRGAVSASAHYTIRYSSSQQTSYTSGTRQVGGLIGNVTSASSTCINSYNTGMLTGGTMGGIRGNTTGTVTNCYYLESCGGTVSGGTSKSEASMKSASFPILLNTDSVVFVMDVNPNVNDGYPIFGDLVCGVTTQEADNINFTSAKLNGFYTPNEYWPGGDADVIGFEYKLSTDANYTTVYTNVSTPASYNLHGLQLGTTYQYRMFVQKDGVTYYGNIVSFSTLSCDLQASVATSVSEMCEGSIATFTASCTSEHSNYFIYQWNNNVTGDILQVTDGETYTVTVQDTNGCSTTAEASVTVHPLPNGIISGQTSLCRGQSTTLTASGANRYSWSTGASSPTITVNESGTYTCTFTNIYNCSAARGVTVTVYDNPVITGETEFCADGNTTLTAIGDAISYTWSTGETTPSITVTTPGTYSVTATFAGGCNCSSTSVTVVEHELPVVSISGTPVICSGIGAPLNVSEGISYLWSTGETTQSITADHTGIFSVSVTDANGCTNAASVEVTELIGIAIIGDNDICQGETTTLSVEMEGEYVWSTGAQTSSITVSEAGPYSVTLSLPNGCSASATSNVIVNALPNPTISGITTICQGETTTLTANDGVSYLWNNDSTNASITIGTAGMYTVTATNAQGCSATASTYVTVNALPTPTISGITTICQGEATTLTANGGTLYQWSDNSTNASITVNTPGQYMVTATNAQGCSATASSYVTVNALPVPTISGNTSICQGTTTMLTANGGTSYLWSNSSTSTSISVGTAGMYTVTATNAQGCSAAASTYVTVNALPTPTISGNTSICQGETTTLTASGGVSYLWNNNSTNASITVSTSGTYRVTATNAQGCTRSVSTYVTVYPTYNTPRSRVICQGESYDFFGQSLTESGIYEHTLYSVHGCDSIITLTLTVQTPQVTISGNVNLCGDDSTILTASGADSYVWSTGETTPSITVAPTATTTYSVTGTTLYGCSGTASVTVNVMTVSINAVSIRVDSTVFIPDGPQCVNALGTQCFSSSVNFTAFSPGATITSAADILSVRINMEHSYIGDISIALKCPNQNSVLLMEQPCGANNGRYFGEPFGYTNHTSYDETTYCDESHNPPGTGWNYCWSDNTSYAQIASGYCYNHVADGNYNSSIDSSNVAARTNYYHPYQTFGNLIGCPLNGLWQIEICDQYGIDNGYVFGWELILAPEIFNEINLGDSTVLVASGAENYLWSTGETTSSIIVAPTVTTTYSVTGTNQYGCTDTASITVTVTTPAVTLPTVITSSITDITPTTATCGGNVTYNGNAAVTARGVCWSTSNNPTVYDSYTEDGTGTGVYTSSITGLIPNTTYYVRAYATNSFGTAYGDEVSFTTPCNNVEVTITGITSLCEGESTTLVVTGADTYLWNNGSTNNSINIDAEGTYSVIGTDTNGCWGAASAIVTVHSITLPVISVNGTISACLSSTATLFLNESYSSYLWSTGEVSPTIDVSEPGYYWVAVTDDNGCTATSEIIQLGASTLIPDTASICVVSVENNHNLIVWEVMDNPNVESYRVYRENNYANVFELLATVPATQTNAYLDTTANPSVRAYRYKLTAMDVCYGETPMSDFHKTVHLTINQGLNNSWNLIWTPYEGMEFPSYRLYRGTNPDTLDLIATMPSTLTSMTDFEAPEGPLFYQIEMVMDGSCQLFIRDNTSYTSARSNIVYNGIAAITNYDGSGLTLYPNPTTGIVTIRLNPETCNSTPEIQLFDIYGRRLQSVSVTGENTQVDLSHYSTGVYIVKLMNGGKVVAVRKVVKE